MTGSIRFDRAAESYDRTRTLPDEVAERQAALLDGELRGRGPVLEIGVGTGRIACTLAVPVVGLDLSRPMMEVLRAKTGSIPLVEGDATALPFPDGAFGAAYAAHVLHLVHGWEGALAELVRVVRPGGVVMAVRGSGRTDVGADLDASVAVRRRPIGADTMEQIDTAARARGLDVRALEEIAWTAPFDIGVEIARIEQRSWSGLWEVDDDELRRAIEAVRAWAIERFGSATAVVPARASFAWHAYDVP